MARNYCLWTAKQQAGNTNDKLIIKQSKINPNQNIIVKITFILTRVNLEADYFVVALDTETDRATSAKTTMKMHNEFSNMFPHIGCFRDIFSIKVRDATKPYQVAPRHITYAL